MTNLEISLVVPAYEPEQYMPRFIAKIKEFDEALNAESLKAELIFIHNGAKSSILEIFPQCKSISIKYLFFANKISPGSARNIGVNNSAGEYIFFHDVDDLINIDFLKNLKNYFEKNTTSKNIYDCIIFQYRKIRNNNIEVINHGLEESNIEVNQELLNDYIKLYNYEPHIYTLFVHCWSKLYRKNFLVDHKIQFKEGLEQLEDVNFNFKMLINSPKIFYSGNIGYDYSVGSGGGNLSSKSGINPTRDIKCVIKSLLVVKKYLKMRGVSKVEVKKRTRHLYATIYVLWVLRAAKSIAQVGSLYNSIGKYIDAKAVQSSMRYYVRMPGTSWVVPLLVRLKMQLFLTAYLRLKN